jgi:hypothetical protein
MELEHLGYKLCPIGDHIRYDFVGTGQPDSEQVSALLDELRMHKEEALSYLKLRESTQPEGTQSGLVCVVGDESSWLQMWVTPETSGHSNTTKRSRRVE